MEGILYEKQAHGTVAQVCERLEAACGKHAFGVLGTHDLKQKMADKGVTFARQCRILEVCNPQQAKSVLEANMSISTALPCRISVYEQGRGVTVSTLKPTAVLGMFGSPQLAPVAREVEQTLMRIIDEACS